MNHCCALSSLLSRVMTNIQDLQAFSRYLTRKNMFQKPKISMHSSIITLCSMKDRRRIVPRSRQLVNRRLRRCNGPAGRFESSASHETCDLHLQRTAQTWFQILTNKSEHFGNCPRRQTLEDPLKGILRERTKALWMAICGTSTIRLQTA